MVLLAPIVTSCASKNRALTGDIKKLASQTAVYGLGTLLPRMLNFLLVPIQTRIFPKEDYASISELYAYAAFLNIIFLFGMETAFFRYANKENGNQHSVFQAAQTLVVFVSGFLTILILAFTPTLASALRANPSAIIWLALTLFIDALVAIPFARMRLQQKSKAFAVLKITNVLLLIAPNLYLAYLKKSAAAMPGIEFIFIVNALANAVFLLYFFKDLIQWRPLLSKELTPKMLSYSYPLVITGLAGMTNEMFSRISLDNWLPPDFYEGKTAKYMQGVFAACYKFSVFMSIAVQAFRFAAEPFFFSKAADKNSPALFARVNHYFVVITTVILVSISLNLGWLKYFVDAESWQGLNMVPILLLGYLFLGIYYNMSVWFKITDRTHYGTLITAAGAIITIGANYWLIPLYGIMGSSVATALCYFSMTVACYLTGQRYFPVPYSIAKDTLILTIGFTLALAFQKFAGDGLAWIMIGALVSGGLVLVVGRWLRKSIVD